MQFDREFRYKRLMLSLKLYEIVKYVYKFIIDL